MQRPNNYLRDRHDLLGRDLEAGDDAAVAPSRDQLGIGIASRSFVTESPSRFAHSTMGRRAATSTVTSRPGDAASHRGDSIDQTRKQAVREEEHDQDEQEAEHAE